VKDMLKYLAQEATNPMIGFDRSGKKTEENRIIETEIIFQEIYIEFNL